MYSRESWQQRAPLAACCCKIGWQPSVMQMVCIVQILCVLQQLEPCCLPLAACRLPHIPASQCLTCEPWHIVLPCQAVPCTYFILLPALRIVCVRGENFPQLFGSACVPLELPPTSPLKLYGNQLGWAGLLWVADHHLKCYLGLGSCGVCAICCTCLDGGNSFSL